MIHAHKSLSYREDQRKGEQVTDSELDILLDAYFDGKLQPEQEHELSEYVIMRIGEGAFDVCGLVVSEDLIPDYSPDWAMELLAPYLDEPRISELWEGAPPTAPELELFRAAWLHNAVRALDDDRIPAFGALRLEHSDGRSCYGVMMQRGCSFSGITDEFCGLFADEGAVLQYLRSLGRIDEVEIERPAAELIERARASSKGPTFGGQGDSTIPSAENAPDIEAPVFLMNVPHQIQADWDSDFAPVLAGFPVNILYSGIRQTQSGNDAVSCCYWFDPGTYAENDDSREMTYFPRVDSPYWVKVEYDKKAGLWRTAKHYGNKLVSAAQGPEFESAMMQTALAGLEPHEPID